MPHIELINNIFSFLSHIFPDLGMSVGGDLLNLYSQFLNLFQQINETSFLQSVGRANFCYLHDGKVDDFTRILVLECVGTIFDRMTCHLQLNNTPYLVSARFFSSLCQPCFIYDTKKIILLILAVCLFCNKSNPM